MSIVVVGSVALDTVKTPFGKVKNALGGSAAYFAVSASFFTKTRLLSVAGKDFSGKFITFLQSRGIDTTGLQAKKGKTFQWSGRYSYDLNNPQTLKTALNLLARFNPHVPVGFRKEPFLFLANIDPRVQLAVLNQMQNPKLVVCDTMNYWIEHNKNELKRVVKRSDILIVNDAEARQFSQQSNLVKATQWLLGLGPRLVIIKRGQYGCLLASRSLTFSIPAYLLEKVIDPTGAGDTFAGGFLGYLASCPKISESALKKAVAYGTVMASFVVEDFSINRLKRLSNADIQARFRQLQRLTRF